MWNWFLEYPDGTRVPTSPPPYGYDEEMRLPPLDLLVGGDRTKDQAFNNPFGDHTINQDGIDSNQGYAEMLVRDSDPSQTARMLKRTIDDYGDQGRGDVADLLARFQKIDGTKAEELRRELHKATDEVLPYRLAPLGQGFREPTEEEKIAAAPKVPFGSAQGADRWAAGNMADVLLGKGDYADAITHFRGEVGRNRAEAMPYLAAVYEIMGEKNPAQAAKFATQMQKAGLAETLEKKPETAPIPPAPAPRPEPKPTPPPPNPQSTPNSAPEGSSKQAGDGRFERFAKGTFDVEGGYSNDPNDRGGETNHGITKDVLDAYQKRHGGLGAGGEAVGVKDLSQQQAKTIYKEVFYNDRRIDEIKDNKTVEHVFDLGINHQPKVAGKMVQKAINNAIPGSNLTVDGVVGSKTIEALNKATPDQLKIINNTVADEREAFYRRLVDADPSQGRFLNGWVKHAKEFRP